MICCGGRDAFTLSNIIPSPIIPTTTLVPVSGPPGPPGAQGPAGPAGGTATEMTAGVALSGHRLVTRNTSGAAIYADATNAGHINAPLWLTLGAASLGDQVSVQSAGIVTEPSWSWTPGPLYLSTNGQLTQISPTASGAVFLVQVGYATSATSVVLGRQPSIKLV